MTAEKFMPNAEAKQAPVAPEVERAEEGRKPERKLEVAKEPSMLKNKLLGDAIARAQENVGKYETLAAQASIRAEKLFQDNQKRAKALGGKSFDKDSAYYRDWYFTKELAKAYQKLSAANASAYPLSLDEPVVWIGKDGRKKQGVIVEKGVNPGEVIVQTEKNKGGFAVREGKLTPKSVADVEDEVAELENTVKLQIELKKTEESRTGADKMETLAKAAKESYKGFGGFFRKVASAFGAPSAAEKAYLDASQRIYEEQAAGHVNPQSAGRLSAKARPEAVEPGAEYIAKVPEAEALAEKKTAIKERAAAKEKAMLDKWSKKAEADLTSKPTTDEEEAKALKPRFWSLKPGLWRKGLDKYGLDKLEGGLANAKARRIEKKLDKKLKAEKEIEEWKADDTK